MDTQGLKLIDGKEKDLAQFIMFVIVSLMDNSNVLEMRKFPVFWFCLHSPRWAGRGGQSVSKLSEHQIHKIVNLTWIKITARLNIY